MLFLVLYYLATVILSVVALVYCKKHIKSDKTKDLIFKIVAIVTVFLHYSDLWFNYLSTGNADMGVSHLFAVYPCHIIMWISLIASLLKNKKGKFFNFLVVFIFYIGIICTSVGIIFNDSYLSNMTLKDYVVVKGLVGHSTLFFICLYVFVMGYMKVDFKFNFISVILGLLVFIVQGTLLNTLFKLCNIDGPNVMYLNEPPFESLPFINTLTIGIAGVILSFIWILIMEYFFLPKEKRFFYKLKQRNKE